MDTTEATLAESSARSTRLDIEYATKLKEKFIVEEKIRAGSTSKKDKFYIEKETGLKFFSKKDALRYMKEGDTRYCKKKPEKLRLTEQEMVALRERCQKMEKESAAASIEATNPQGPSPKRGRSTEFVDDRQSYATPIEEATSVELDINAIIASLSEVELPSPTFSNETSADAATGNTSYMVTTELDISDFEIITAADRIEFPKLNLKKEPENQQNLEIKPEVEMQDPTMVNRSSEKHQPVDLESELALQNSVLLDALRKGQEDGFVIPFDVTSYPIWNDLREREDELYWASWTPGPSDTSAVDNQWLPPDLR